MDRQQVVEALSGKRSTNTVVDLAFYAYRDMASCDWRPFVKAAVERSPVSLGMVKDLPMDQITAWLEVMSGQSIYDAQRLAQPDEVANFRTGDGAEKAFVLANVLHRRRPDQPVRVILDGDHVVVKADAEYSFTSSKDLHQEVLIDPGGEIRAS
jgi:hypothetical protein